MLKGQLEAAEPKKAMPTMWQSGWLVKRHESEAQLQGVPSEVERLVRKGSAVCIAGFGW